MDVAGFHLPAGTADDAPLHVIAEHAGVRVSAPLLEPRHIHDICDRLIAARRALQLVPVAHIIDVIDAATRRLREEHAEAAAALSAITGYSAPMAAAVLERMSRDWLAPALHTLVRSEFGAAAVLDGFAPGPAGAGTRVRAVAPSLGLHVFAGNVPGVSVTSIVRALLVRSAVLGKSAAAEPVLAPLFARLVSQVDATVGDAVAVTWWRGGDEALEAAALRRAGLVVHYGGEDAITSLRARAERGTLFIEHGPRISFALVRAHPDMHDAARAAAYAVAMFDQQGCVSPQTAYVVGSHSDATAFAALVADELRRLHHDLPRGRIASGEATAIRELRTSAEFRAFRGEDVALFADESLAWTIVVENDPAFGGSCLNRTLIIRHVNALDELLPLLAPFARFLQTVGVAGFDPRELEAAAALLAGAGVTRVTPLAEMPWPPPTWHHDGRGPLRELVRWVDLEETEPAG